MSKKEFELLQQRIEQLAKQIAELSSEIRVLRARIEPNPYGPPPYQPSRWPWPEHTWM